MTDNEGFLQLKKDGVRLSAVIAMTPSRVIGKDGGMPWRLPEDLKVFKSLTTGHPIVMGRKTFDSLGRLLPNRQHIVMTRDKRWSAEGAYVIHQVADLLNVPLINKDVFVIGGAEIFSLFLPGLDVLWLSKIHQDYLGDTWLPDVEEFFPHKSLEQSYEGFDLWKYTRT